MKDRNAREEFEAGPRIPGAQFFDIDDIAAKGDLNPKGLPHMMPPKQLFAAAMDAMGITNDDHLIVYANKGCVSISVRRKYDTDSSATHFLLLLSMNVLSDIHSSCFVSTKSHGPR